MTIDQKFELLLIHVRTKFPNDSKTDTYNKALKIFEKGHLLNADFIEKSIKDDVENFCKTHGVFSLAQHPDNILLWSHYIYAHKSES